MTITSLKNRLSSVTDFITHIKRHPGSRHSFLLHTEIICISWSSLDSHHQLPTVSLPFEVPIAQLTTFKPLGGSCMCNYILGYRVRKKKNKKHLMNKASQCTCSISPPSRTSLHLHLHHPTEAQGSRAARHGHKFSYNFSSTLCHLSCSDGLRKNNFSSITHFRMLLLL